MNIDDMTYGELKQIANLFSKTDAVNTLNDMIGQRIIVRTYSAGVWFGELEQKAGNEIYLKNARRMWKWWAAKSISLSGVALYGVKPEKSKIAPPVERVWLEAIELIHCTPVAVESIEGAEDAKAE